MDTYGFAAADEAANDSARFSDTRGLNTEITLFEKFGGGILSKRISLGADGQPVSDGSECAMSEGWAERQEIGDLDPAGTFAWIINGMTSAQALATGRPVDGVTGMVPSWSRIRPPNRTVRVEAAASASHLWAHGSTPRFRRPLVLVRPLLPPRPPRPKGGRPPIEDRAALTGILFVLKSGIPWEMLPQEMGCGCGMTCWRRLRDWQEAGIWQAFHHALLDRLGRAGPDRLEPVLLGRGEPARQGGRGCHRAEPDRPRQAGQQAAPRRRPAGHPVGGPAHRRQRARQHRAGGGARRRAADPPAAWPAATPPEEAARRQGVRLPRCRRACRKRGIVPGSPGAGSRAASGSAGTAGWSNGPCPGSPASAG